ncbi:hypothetical protein LguiA_018526 [Lonicera macranthoides]
MVSSGATFLLTDVVIQILLKLPVKSLLRFKCIYHFTNDYKVIWIRYFWNEKLRVAYDPSVIGVYTLGTDSWRFFDLNSSLMPPRLSSISSIYMNGAKYWLSYYDHFNSSIVAFDIGNEVFRVIQMPPEFT